MNQTIITLKRTGWDSRRSELSVLKTQSDPDRAPVFDEAAVAELSADIVRRMEFDELVRSLEAARLPFLTPELRRRLSALDRQTLERLVHLARRCCQTRRAESIHEVSSAGVNPWTH